MELEIKRIRANECGLVVDLFDKYRMFYKAASDKGLAQRFLQARLDNQESVIFLALAADVPAGFTQLYPQFSSLRASKVWVLNDLYVEPKHRKKGIGERLINTVLNFAKEDGAGQVQLSTATDNYTAQRLYEAVGFRHKEPSKEFITYQIDVV